MLDTMIAATGLGYANAPWWSAIAIGLLLTAASSQKHFSRERRYAESGPILMPEISNYFARGART